jgi:hypothetical protein
MPPPFTPLSFVDILDGAVALYRRGFATLLGTTLLASALAVGVDLLLARPLQGTVFPGVAWTVVLAFAWAALTWQVSRLYTGQPVSVNGGLEAAATSLFPLLGAWAIAFVLYGIPVLVAQRLVFGMGVRAGLSGGSGAMVLLALPGIAYLALVAVALSLTFAIVPAVVLEGAGPWQAVARSFRLAGDALVRVAALVLVFIALRFLVGLGLMRVAGGSDPAALASSPALLLLTLARALLLPFMVAAAVLMYYDRRVRSEGLDLRMVADELADGAPEEGADDPEPGGEAADGDEPGPGEESHPPDARDEAPHPARSTPPAESL